jgi:hypothetical protein
MTPLIHSLFSSLFTLCTQLSQETVAVMESISAKHLARGYNGEITQVMREGIAPRVNTSSCSGNKLVLLHGFDAMHSCLHHTAFNTVE